MSKPSKALEAATAEVKRTLVAIDSTRNWSLIAPETARACILAFLDDVVCAGGTKAVVEELRRLLATEPEGDKGGPITMGDGRIVHEGGGE